MTDGDRGTKSNSDENEDGDGTHEAITSEATIEFKIEDSENIEAGLIPEVDGMLPGERRAKSLDNLADQLGATDHLEAIHSTYSLESELVAAGNGAIMRKAYLRLHPRSKKKWDAAIALTGDEQAKAIQAIFDGTRKGDFAQVLARLIEDGDDFIVPDYIARAIEQVVA